MLTSSFFIHTGVGRISIARWAPKATPLGFRTYRALAPGPYFRSVDWDEYRRLYAAQLAQLDPRQVWESLHDLVAPYEPVLLCWERLTGEERCHRRLVAEWFENSLGVSVPELENAPALPPSGQSLDLFDRDF
jgi:hypothetical protein